MFRRSFAFILLGITSATAGYAQVPEPRTDNDRAASALTWSFEGGSYLGVETVNVTRENAGKFGLRDVHGVAVEKVMDGSPAQSAGLQNGDILLKFNGEEVTSVRKLTRLVGEVAPDHQARITFLRGGTEREVNITLGKRPAPKFEGAFGPAIAGQFGRIQVPPMANMPPLPRTGELPNVQAFPQLGELNGDFLTFRGTSSRQIGVGITPLTKQLAEHFGVDKGAIVNNVRENSPAAKAGLKAGDIIVEVDGKAVKGDFDLIRSIASGKKDGSISLTFVRGGSRQTVSVTPEEVKGDFNRFFDFPEVPDAPETPPAPGLIRPRSPAAPSTPTPLNHMLIPGRVI